MANSLTSNVTRKLMRSFIKGFEAARVLTKTCDTQTFRGAFNPASGTTVDIKRPHQYKSFRTSAGDISSAAGNDIVAGKATATVQNFITVPLDWNGLEDAVQMDQLDKIIYPAAEQCVIDLETSFHDFMIQYAALSVGAPGTAVDAWTDVGAAHSLMMSLGVPGDMFYVMNPYTVQNLASAQGALYAGDSIVESAWQRNQITNKFAGLTALASNSLSTYTTGACADRAGALAADPDVTYATCKDTMTQSLSVDSLTTTGVIKAGEILEFTGDRYYTNPRTQKQIFGADGTGVHWRCTVTADVTLSGGAGTLVVSGPAIYESDGQYNNISAALVDNDVFNVLGATATTYQPNMFYSKNAFGIAFVDLPKLYSTDTVAETKDGIVIRCSKYSDGDTNTQKVRFDLLPAFACFNPFYAGKGFGA